MLEWIGIGFLICIGFYIAKYTLPFLLPLCFFVIALPFNILGYIFTSKEELRKQALDKIDFDNLSDREWMEITQTYTDEELDESLKSYRENKNNLT